MSPLPPPPQLAVYNESYLSSLALRNSLKRYGFTVHPVSQNEEELLRFLLMKPAVLIFQADNLEGDSISLIKKIKERKHGIKVLACTIRKEKEYTVRLIQSGADAVMNAEDDFKILIDKLLLLNPAFKLIVDDETGYSYPLQLNPDDPFIKIACDRKKILLTQLLASGNSSKTIAEVMNMPEGDVEALRKKLFHDTHCQNAAEYVAKGKDKKII